MALTDEQRFALQNPLSGEDIESLQDVEEAARLVDTVLTKMELAGDNVTAYRNSLNEARQQANGLLAAFAPDVLRKLDNGQNRN